MNNNSTTDEHVITYDLGCQPSLSGTDELIIQNDRSTYVIFAAIPTNLLAGVRYEPGTAIVECQRCELVRYGYPNDEGLPEHLLYTKGLDKVGGICEVINSSWQAMLEAQMDISARRIWGERYYKAYKVSKDGKREFHFRHFIFQFKETTFECLAENLVLKDLRKLAPDKSYRDWYRDLVIGVLDQVLQR